MLELPVNTMPPAAGGAVRSRASNARISSSHFVGSTDAAVWVRPCAGASDQQCEGNGDQARHLATIAETATMTSDARQSVGRVTGMPIREMLLDTFVHMPPLGALDAITAEDAVRPPADGLHSVAAILAHMEFWQDWFLDRCEGTAVPMAAAAAAGWPTVSAEGWPALVARFEAGLARAARTWRGRGASVRGR